MSYNGRESGSINGRQPPLGQYIEEMDYVIFKEDDVIKAKDGTDGSIAYQSTNAREVITNALDALAPDGGVVFITSGTYQIDKEISLKRGFSDWKLMGAHPRATVLEFLGSGDCFTGTTSGHTRNITLRDFQIKGSSGISRGINFLNIRKSRLENIWINKITDTDAISLRVAGSCWWDLFQNVKTAVPYEVIKDNPSLDVYYPLKIERASDGSNSYQPNADQFINCEFRSHNHGDWAVKILDGSSNSL